MYDKNKDIKELADIKSDNTELLPIVFHLAEIKDISNFSLERIKKRISIKKYQVRNALKRSFYKEITTDYPNGS